MSGATPPHPHLEVPLLWTTRLHSRPDPTQWPRDALTVTTSLNTNQVFLCNACDDQPSSVIRLGYGPPSTSMNALSTNDPRLYCDPLGMNIGLLPRHARYLPLLGHRFGGGPLSDTRYMLICKSSSMPASPRHLHDPALDLLSKGPVKTYFHGF